MLDWLTETMVIVRWEFVLAIAVEIGLGVFIIWLEIKLLNKRKEKVYPNRHSLFANLPNGRNGVGNQNKSNQYPLSKGVISAKEKDNGNEST
jgi:hypothetical protein